MDLNQLLDDAAPRVAEATPALRDELGALVDASRPPTRRLPLRLAAVGGAAALVVTTGAMAAAGGLGAGWSSQSLAANGSCTTPFEFAAAPLPRFDDNNQPSASGQWVNLGDSMNRRESVRVTRAFLADLGQPPEGHDREAAERWAQQQLDDHLAERQGPRVWPIELSAKNDCVP